MKCATAKKPKPTATEPPEDIILQESATTDIITNKNINYGSDKLFAHHQFGDLFFFRNRHFAGLLCYHRKNNAGKNMA
jgi:hypothetical protein